MQKNKSFQTIFLLEFTKALIENSRKEKIVELMPRKKIESPKEIKKIENIKVSKPIRKKRFHQMPAMQRAPISPNISHMNKPMQKILTIPKEKIPQKFNDIQPTLTEKKIDLGKLNNLIKNPQIQSIECNGPNTQLIITEKSRRKVQLKINLTKEEIDKIIETFSKITKIPTIEGVYKVAAGNLVLMAIISDVIGSKFVINKIIQKQNIPQNRISRRNFPNPRMMRR